MIKKASTLIVEFWIKNAIIKTDDKESYCYGMELILSTLINVAFMVILSYYVIGYPIAFIPYIAVYTPLRLTAGGCSCVCSGVLIQGALFLMFASLSFFIVKTDNLRNVLYWNIKSFMGYPISIYPKLIQYFVVYIIPLAFVNYFPSQLLMGVFKEGNIFPAVYISISAALGMVLFGLSYLFWRFSLRFYASTGS